jgi:Carboxypeptidase regulatory-like domain
MSGLAACDAATASPSASAPGPSDSVPVTCGTDEIAASGIEGRAVDSEGNPLNDIFIEIKTADGFRGTTRTTPEGVFTAPGVSGEFVITTLDIDYEAITRRVTVPCGETVEVELVLTAADD